jgi:hypothetical protein
MRVLDLYLLSVIGELPADSSGAVDELIRGTFRSLPDETWQKTLERELHVGPDLKQHIAGNVGGLQILRTRPRSNGDIGKVRKVGGGRKLLTPH